MTNKRQNRNAHSTASIEFKDPLLILEWLQTALEKEKEKYDSCPVTPDRVSGVEVAQGWGFVVAGYFLVELSLKALLHVRGKKVPLEHSLTTLFNRCDESDKIVLREFYIDYKTTIGGRIGDFPIKSLDLFLSNLDGGKIKRGKHIGSFDWRYFPIENKRSSTMPLVSVDYLHELVYGCIRLIEFAHLGRFDPTQYTHSCRLRWARRRKFQDWLTVRMNTEGWGELGDRLEVFWGPDYLGRYDLYLFEGKQCKVYFSEIPNDFPLPVLDKRREVEDFNVEEGYRSIGVTSISPPKIL